MITNKRGHLDARNALGVWSFIKWIVDTIMVIGGGGILASHPSVEIFSLVFVLWLWALIKEVGDTPLVIIWTIGKWSHWRRNRKRRKHNREIKILGVKL